MSSNDNSDFTSDGAFVDSDPPRVDVADVVRERTKNSTSRDRILLRHMAISCAALVRRARADAGFTQAQLAAEVGVSQERISQLENATAAKGTPEVYTLARIAHACGRTLRGWGLRFAGGALSVQAGLDFSRAFQHLPREAGFVRGLGSLHAGSPRSSSPSGGYLGFAIETGCELTRFPSYASERGPRGNGSLGAVELLHGVGDVGD